MGEKEITQHQDQSDNFNRSASDEESKGEKMNEQRANDLRAWAEQADTMADFKRGLVSKLRDMIRTQTFDF